MNRTVTILFALSVGVAIGVTGGSRLVNLSAEAQTAATTSFSAVPDAIGEQDISGPYQVQAGWPKDLSTLPGHEKWTYGGARGIFAESPNRVFLLGGGELPKMARPQAKLLTDVGPSVQFPIAGLPWRNANTASPPGAGGSRQDAAKGMEMWRGSAAPFRELGVDARWHHSITVVDAQGNITEDWTQWDNMFKRPHAVYISPYDAQKRVWIVDDHTHAIYIFSNDGKQHLQTIGTPNVPGADGTHFNRPTFMAWLPDGTFYVADGYNGTRVAKFDASGKFLMDFGMPGDPGKETRPGYMNNVHGVAVDVETRRVFVNDRDNNRIQIFDENGKYLSEWKITVRPSSLHYVVIGDDRKLVTFDRNTHKMLKYELDGRLIYSWGTLGDFPGTLWGVHGMATDQEGNLYVAEVDAGRFQKFRPRAGANPAALLGKPVYSAWR
jgi:DNA-binding beta-propeller fold protein YncE